MRSTLRVFNNGEEVSLSVGIRYSDFEVLVLIIRFWNGSVVSIPNTKIEIMR